MRLRAHGMNVDDCTAAYSDGRLICWLNLHPSHDFVAHTATVWSNEEGVALLYQQTADKTEEVAVPQVR
jgi:hypothetical protein